jgi:hypothetical protein
MIGMIEGWFVRKKDLHVEMRVTAHLSLENVEDTESRPTESDRDDDTFDISIYAQNQKAGD